MTSIQSQLDQVLAPCPFCGGAADIWPEMRGPKPDWLVTCRNKECIARPESSYENKHDAMTAWNTRATINASVGGGEPVDSSLEDGALAHIYNLCPTLPVTADTAGQATDALLAFCMFYGARNLLAQSTTALKTKKGLDVLRELSEINKALGLDYFNTAPPAAIRAAVGGEAVAWMLRRKRDDFVRGCYATKPTDESLEFAELDGDYYTPLYASPTATVDVGALREVMEFADRCDDVSEESYCAEIRNQLAALIGEKA